jgi:ribosomal protein L36
MKKLLNTLQSFRIGLQMEAEPKPRKKEHYLIRRIDRLRVIHKLAWKDQNLLKVRQAEYLIKRIEERLNANGQLLMAHIEQKEVIN